MSETIGRPQAEAQREFVKARNRRNIMIAWSLVAFMVLMFSITAVRLMQNMADRAEQGELTEVVDEAVAAEQE
ncbi:protoheme IX farnesyltransferase [Hyphobacterium sp.]|uniref:protoheme IX farnesyltransferase n=1 Tax=Hyphobacterium sp. TaxID=2004662 RepID=UPI003BABC1BC